MSHASAIVAISPEQIREHGELYKAIEWNMEPFNEHEWFGDGSRWDWYTIGGRYTGKFIPDYNPETDPDNIEVCWLCHGTGKRTDMVVFNGCNGCAGTGKKVKFTSHWKSVGNIALRSKINHLEGKLTAYAFLKNRCWNELARLGWFGGEAATECEIRSKETTGEEYTGKCVFRNEELSSKIVSWQENKKTETKWNDMFWARFIRHIPDDWTLVCVDYHV